MKYDLCIVELYGLNSILRHYRDWISVVPPIWRTICHNSSTVTFFQAYLSNVIRRGLATNVLLSIVYHMYYAL